jgi:hypothetical protein
MQTEISLRTMFLTANFNLLDSTVSRLISRMMDGDVLLTCILILIFLIFTVVSAIYLYLFFRKRNFIYKNRLRKHIETLVTQVLMEEYPDTYAVPGRFHRILNNRVAKQFAIDELVRCKKNFSGTFSEGIVALYIQLGLKQYSLRKLSGKNKWHIKARGIQELYLMDQRDVLTTIYKNTNNRNEFIRMEAQTGVINLTGFPGLRFLDVISYPLTEWQQLKLLEQLRLYPEKEELSDRIPKWLLSKNETVICFALKLAEEYQQFSVRNAVTGCLVHPNEEVRQQAIRTLVKLADDKTPAILSGYFNKEPVINQSLILDALTTMATEDQSDFLREQLDHPDNSIKLKAAIALAGCCTNGLAIIERKAVVEPEPYQRIYNYVTTMR